MASVSEETQPECGSTDSVLVLLLSDVLNEEEFSSVPEGVRVKLDRWSAQISNVISGKDSQISKLNATVAELQASIEKSQHDISETIKELDDIKGNPRNEVTSLAQEEESPTNYQKQVTDAQLKADKAVREKDEMVIVVQKRNEEIERLVETVKKLSNQLQSPDVAKIQALDKIDELTGKQLEFEYKEKEVVGREKEWVSQGQLSNDDVDFTEKREQNSVAGLPPSNPTKTNDIENNLHLTNFLGENQALKDSEEKLRLQQSEATRRENILVMRLATKEQEMHDYAAQINELKNSMIPTPGSLKSSLLDPAVNFIIQKMKKELTETKKKLEDTQNDLNAWKFTADSNTGKRLMAKCRMLYQENEDLGKMITSGRLAKLESDLALQKSLTDEMKKAQSEMDDLVQELDEDVEGMQSTIFFLQQQLREKINTNAANSASHNSSDNIMTITVNTTELCAQCRAAQEKKHLLNHHPSSSANNAVKMEIDSLMDDDNCRTQDSSNLSENERTFLNGESELYSPDRESGEQAKFADKRTREHRLTYVSKQPHSVNLLAESTLESSNNCNVGSTVQTPPCNAFEESSKIKSSATLQTADVNDKPSDDESLESDNIVKPPAAKRTKLSSGNRGANVGQTQNVVEESRTVGPIMPLMSRNRNGAVDHT